MKQRDEHLRQMRAIWDLKETEELISVWVKNDRHEWTDDTFIVIGQILLERTGRLPPQTGESASPSVKKRKIPVKVLVPIALVLLLCLGFEINRRIITYKNSKVLRNETRVIELTASAHPKQLVFENDMVKVSISYDQYMEYLKTKYVKSKGSHDDIEYVFKRRKEIDSSLRNRSTFFLNGRNGEYITAEMLEQGKASVYDKRKQAYVKTIKINYYDFICGPLCGQGTRSFYFSDEVLIQRTYFLTVVDWVS